jgi:SWI/SNF-related matrix-associated actin-dependent regulator of chromatin subfamily A member 5
MYGEFKVRQEKEAAAHLEPPTTATTSPRKHQHHVVPTILPNNSDDEILSPPALTDTSLPTPALTGSRVSTPKYMEPPQSSKNNKRASEGGVSGESRTEKKARLDAKVWSVGSDPLLRAFE